jgi:hypothetical protein
MKMPRESNITAHPNALTWQDHLALARSAYEVVEISRHYLATWEPSELTALPADCQPPELLENPEAIVTYSFILVQCHYGLSTDNAELYRMANFFTHATRRVAQLMSGDSHPAANSSLN